MNGVGRWGKFGCGHLSVVPSAIEFKISETLNGLISIEELPRSFRLFKKVTFMTDDQIPQFKGGEFLIRAITKWREKIALNSDFLAPFADHLRIGGIKNVIFKFALNIDDKQVLLKIAGANEDTPPMKTEVLLFDCNDNI